MGWAESSPSSACRAEPGELQLNRGWARPGWPHRRTGWARSRKVQTSNAEVLGLDLGNEGQVFGLGYEGLALAVLGLEISR